MINERSLTRAAVLIPLYKESMSKAEEFSFKNTVVTLRDHDIYVICPIRLNNYVEKLKKNNPNLGAVYFQDKYFSGISGYNQLLKSYKFYGKFKDYEYLLIVQTDALVFSDRLDEWCNRGYSYVGAPLFKGFDNPVNPLVFVGGGNGGFSLRKVNDFIRVLSYPRYIPNVVCGGSNLVKFVKHNLVFSYSFPQLLQPRINEDAFWGMLVPRNCDFFTVAAPEDALSFAFEVAPEYLYEFNKRQLPFGCHAWEKYNLPFWRKILHERGMELP